MSFWTILLLIMFALPAFIVGILLSLFLLLTVLVLAELGCTAFTFTKKGNSNE